MAVLEGGVSALLAGTGEEPFIPMHVGLRPLSFGGLGHYRTSVRFALANSQAANSRLFQMRNTGTNIIIPTRLRISWLQIAAHTAAILDSLDCYKYTAFTVTDTTATVTPTASPMTGAMGAAPGNVDLRHVTVAGAAAGMTGGTLTKGTNALSRLEKWLLLAVPTAGPMDPSVMEVFENTMVEGGHPPVFAGNEGFGIENRVLLGAAAGSSVVVDFSYIEAPPTAF
jgi:hypothetical protein